MESYKIRKSTPFNDDDLDIAIAEAIDHFAQHNIRFRSPNRGASQSQQPKQQKTEPEFV